MINERCDVGNIIYRYENGETFKWVITRAVLITDRQAPMKLESNYFLEMRFESLSDSFSSGGSKDCWPGNTLHSDV